MKMNESSWHQRFVSKSVLSEEYTPELINEFDNVKIVYVLRNPLGHWNSYKNNIANRNPKNKDSSRKKISRQADFRYLDYGLIDQWLFKMHLSYKFARKYYRAYPKNFYILTFDHLLSNPKPELEKLCSFLEIDYQDCLLSPTVLNSDFDGNSWYVSQKNVGIDSSAKDFWKTGMNALELSIITEAFNDVIHEFNFENIPYKKISKYRFLPGEKISTYLINRFFLRAMKRWIK